MSFNTRAGSIPAGGTKSSQDLLAATFCLQAVVSSGSKVQVYGVGVFYFAMLVPTNEYVGQKSMIAFAEETLEVKVKCV